MVLSEAMVAAFLQLYPLDPAELGPPADRLVAEVFRQRRALVPLSVLLPPLMPAGAFEEARALGLVATWDRGDGTWATLTPLGELLAEDHGVELIEPIEPIGDEDVSQWDHRGKPARPIRAERIPRTCRIGYPERYIAVGPSAFELVTDGEGRVMRDALGNPAYRFIGLVKAAKAGARKRGKARRAG